MNTQNEKGFTLIELIVVIAIMGIVGAVLVPQFATMTLRSRMSTDVTTVKELQNQTEIYYAQTGGWPGSTTDEIVQSLVSASYLDGKYLTAASKVVSQTKGADIVYVPASHKFYLKVTADDFGKYNKQEDKDASWIAAS